MTTAHPPGVAGIEVSGLVKSFKRGRVRAVDGIDFRIQPGETVALLGPNGAGKSTTIDMLLGLGLPDHGTVSVFGRSPAEAVQGGTIGAMLQTGQLIQEMTVRELVLMVGSLYPHPLPVDEVLRLAGMVDLADRRAHRLSGGEVQRTRFAIALVGNADLMVLDEPTAALDVEGRHEFWTAMRGIAAQGKTILFATHYLEEADDFADRIILMAKGRIVADGPTTEIKARVGQRTIRATLPDVELDVLKRLPGVVAAQRFGEAVTLTCKDSDAALRGLLTAFSQIRDIEVRGAGLEEAFLELTAEPATPLSPLEAGR